MTDLAPQVQELAFKVLSDLGAASNAALVVVGDRLGLYTALADRGPSTPAELAEHTHTNERNVSEWLSAQAASGYINYDAATQQFSMSPEQAMAFADPDSPVYMIGGFYAAAAANSDEAKLAEAFRTGAGVPWGAHHNCLFCGTEKFFRPGYVHNITQNWLPALDGMVARLQAGATVADLGCGHGLSTHIMARAFPKSRFIGFDVHGPSIDRAREIARDENLSNVRFELAAAQEFPILDGQSYDFVAMFDALHDMGDPLGAARQVRRKLKSDGAWMIVEPAASDRLEENLHPIGRAFYAASTSFCVPGAQSQPGGYALGAQAGPAAIKKVLRDAGFDNVRIAATTPFNLIFEARR
jgi:ubiquinone/menaquinone biosynthesis C-methylase UbiE